ncbi:bacillithiol biosynthesis BshC [Candidatus Thorarchaeota archaeon]|nr:MAG: bacillithiol biosynthesis BshC [Candidatus Thorarchaeota archaeon]
MRESVTKVYEDYIWKGEMQEEAEYLYGKPPVYFGDLEKSIGGLREQYEATGWFTEERREGLETALRRINRDLGALTPRVDRTISGLSDGAVEGAHQSIVFGGPCYVLNKAATASRLADVSSKNEPLASYFFVADYDEVQPELINTRTPLLGSSGNLLSIPVPKEYTHSPVSILPLPSYTWYEEAEESIRQGYRPMVKDLDQRAQLAYEERLEQILALTRWAFLNSDTLGQWAQRILARLFNVEGNLGIPIIPYSDPEIRELAVFGMEFLLQRENREKFLRVQDEATDRILELGLEPGTGRRDQSYVPFLYECPQKGCNRSRFELQYYASGSDVTLSGRCPSCNEYHTIEVSGDDPDLTDHANCLSPRVDSRQFIVDTIVPTVCHVGGPGETAYYAQVIPAAGALGIPFPQFVKYPRLFFNTPWNEALANRLKKREQPVLHEKTLFRLLGKIGKARRNEEYDEMNSYVNALGHHIKSQYDILVEKLTDIEERRDSASGDEGENLQQLSFDIELYLSWAYGRYAQEKSVQESSWSWIEWAINAGIADIFGPYERNYVEQIKNGATLWINFMI